jgi:hypothetical protein
MVTFFFWFINIVCFFPDKVDHACDSLLDCILLLIGSLTRKPNPLVLVLRRQKHSLISWDRLICSLMKT